MIRKAEKFRYRGAAVLRVARPVHHRGENRLPRRSRKMSERLEPAWPKVCSMSRPPGWWLLLARGERERERSRNKSPRVAGLIYLEEKQLRN